MIIQVSARDSQEQQVFLSEPVTVRSLLNMVHMNFPYDIIICRIDRELASLETELNHDCSVELLDMRDQWANMAYQVSLTFLFIAAVHDVLGKNVSAVFPNSLSRGLFIRLKTDRITNETAARIEARMRVLQEEALPIRGQWMDREKMEEWVIKNGRREQIGLVNTAKDLKGAWLYRLDNETDMFFHVMVPDTGYLKYFELKKYKSGLLMRFPHSAKPDEIPEYEEEELIYGAFSEANHWNRLTRVEYACDLNRLVNENNMRDLILLSEALHEKRVAALAEQIREAGKRIILIAGPSSSGKTTFARRLCIQLRVAGLRPLYLGTDDYFHEREETPLLENGEKDYESIRAIDVELFAMHMNDLLKGKKVDLPTYDFFTGKKKYGTRITTVDAGQPVVIEGIHALNPALTEGIPDQEKFRIYISPLTQLNIDAHNRTPTTDARMLRRIVRDHNFRGYSARTTIKAWPAVRAGENVNIFPYNTMADAFFNSHCSYELAVLKKYALPLLKEIPPDTPEYPEARRLLEMLECFSAMEDDSMIPNNSIMREFIGGSILAE